MSKGRYHRAYVYGKGKEVRIGEIKKVVEMTVTDTSPEMQLCYNAECFDIEKWKAYIDGSVPGAKDLCINDMRECINSGYVWEKDFLPVLNEVIRDVEKRIETVRVFGEVTDRLDERIVKAFGRPVEADIFLYLGLCNGAGWVTTIDNRTTVLLGIEKIMELGWYDLAKMTGLIIHELGHVYHKQYGLWDSEMCSLPERFLRQLFIEGIAMVFEQEVVGDPDFYQQDADGWKQWCDCNAEHIRNSFYKDMHTMTHEDQRYFGDWVKFEGHGDTGYYLGTKFVRFLLKQDSFDYLIQYDMTKIREGFDRFMLADL